MQAITQGFFGYIQWKCDSYKSLLSMDCPAEYLTSKLTEVLISLRADAERVTLRHKNQVLSLKEVIEAKDLEIKELKNELEVYRRAAANNNNKGTDLHTASFKKITLGKKTPKNISIFTSDTTYVSSPQMAQSVLMERKANCNIQSTKNLCNVAQRVESCNSVKFFKNASNANLNKDSVNNKQNLKMRTKKPSITSVNPRNERQASTILTTPVSKGRLNSSIRPTKNSQKRGESKQSKAVSRDKRCINVLIPTVNFSTYAINSIKTKQTEIT